MIDCTGLENRRTERYRGFESLSLRNDTKGMRPLCHFFVSESAVIQKYLHIAFSAETGNMVSLSGKKPLIQLMDYILQGL